MRPLKSNDGGGLCPLCAISSSRSLVTPDRGLGGLPLAAPWWRSLVGSALSSGACRWRLRASARAFSGAALVAGFGCPAAAARFVAAWASWCGCSLAVSGACPCRYACPPVRALSLLPRPRLPAPVWVARVMRAPLLAESEIRSLTRQHRSAGDARCSPPPLAPCACSARGGRAAPVRARPRPARGRPPACRWWPGGRPSALRCRSWRGSRGALEKQATVVASPPHERSVPVPAPRQ